MKTELLPITGFTGLMTQVDQSQVPLGGALNTSNLAMFAIGRLRRIPGVTAIGTAGSDAITQIPLMLYAKDITAGNHYTYGVLVGATTVMQNMTTGGILTGAAFTTPAFELPWSTTWYSQKYLVAGGGNTIRQIDSATAQSVVAGTIIPAGDLVQSFQDKLYVSGIAGNEGVVMISDILTTNFNVLNIINVKEIPGKVTALGINSPSTQSLGIATQLLIFKSTAFWTWDASSKVLVSSAIGTNSPRTLVNTAAGTIFLGNKEGKYSVYLLSVGTFGEPIDIGAPLYDILNGTTKLMHLSLAHAVRDGRFYKLYFSLDSENTNVNEVWLDIDTLTSSHSYIWYGVHHRGSFDSAVNNGLRLELAQRGASGSNVWFAENASATANFVKTDTTLMTAILDLPINANPVNMEKEFDLLELLIASEANTAGNTILVEILADGTSLGTTAVTLYEADTNGISHVNIPLRAAGRSAAVAVNMRIKITHSLNTRLDILGGNIQYLYHEGPSDIKSK